ncbi:TetR/AcrR family transcriptional regulator C-terminal domain-containing protein [Candidatus Sodalis endolongispinus]|uniref:TetR/AcrR family transcriptional regulator C-terminal domain-containing protein n=1 Tax=Candidatus Sodalis endolongispinus TaxID=2812662 RepID=UPI0028A935BF|nr:TetR/AcrR family transcriptional regulator C-terminal domain-containing protein [Candidatus Sodalis endolongispinus]
MRTYATLFLIRAAQELSSAEQEKLTFADKLQRFGEGMLGAMTSDWKAMQLYRMVVGEAAYSDIGELFYDSGVRESMHALEGLMQRHMESGDLSPGCPVLRAKQFSALVKAEADELFLKRELPVYSAKQVALMVASAVAVFLQGAR